MKKHILTTLFFVAFVATCFAQNNVEARAKSEVDLMVKVSPTITQEQKDKLLAASMQRINSADSLRKIAGPGNQPDVEKMKVISNKWNEAFKAIFSREQREAYWEMLKKEQGN